MYRLFISQTKDEEKAMGSRKENTYNTCKNNAGFKFEKKLGVNPF